MKVVAQSEVPAKPAFYHLAYGASIVENDIWPPFIILAAVAVLIFQKLNSKRLWGMLVTLCVGLGMIIGIHYWAESNRLHRSDRTRVMGLHSIITNKLRNGEKIPLTLTDMRKQWGISETLIRDRWGHEPMLYTYKKNGKSGFRVISAGPDGKFMTRDDIAYPPVETEAQQ